MALDARHRSSIHRKLVPLLGEEDAGALMSQFPSVDTDEWVNNRHRIPEASELGAYIRETKRVLTIRFFVIVSAFTVVVATLSMVN